jgi:hypothetical protein
MSRLEAHDTPWADFATIIQGNGAAEPKATCPVNRSEQERQRWQAVLDRWLLKWAQDPSRLEDEGVVPPSADILQLACQLAGDLRDAGAPGPQRVAATGDGGIVFVRQVGPSLSTLEVGADGSIELTVFRDSRLLSRQRLR